MKDICFISLLVGVFTGMTAHAQPQPTPLNPVDFLPSGHVKALQDLLGREDGMVEKDSLFQLYILPNPFTGNPDHDLDFWYAHLQSIDYRPEAGAFLYTGPGYDPAPPTLCIAPGVPDPKLDADPGSYITPLQASRFHRMLTSFDDPVSPDSIDAILDALTRWDPGQMTANLITSLQDGRSCTPEQLQKWTNRLLFFEGLRDTTRSGQLTSRLVDQRLWVYQEALDNHPFIYSEPVDYYGRVLAASADRQLPAWTALYDLIQTRHPRILYYLAATAYRAEVLRSIRTPIPFMQVLEAFSGMEIHKDQLGQWVSHFFIHSDQWIWSDQRQRFYYYPEVKDHQLLVESWFRYLASPDPKIATTFYRQIINADPAIVAQYSGNYRQILTQWNPVLPPANLPFPEITAHFRADAREREERLTLPPGIAGLTEQLLQPLSLSDRIRLEDSLISQCTPNDLTALEAQALEWVAYQPAEQSLSRIVDHHYRRNRQRNQIKTFLRKSGFFLDPDRGDAASRYMTMLYGWHDLAAAKTWYRTSDDPASRAAVQELLPLTRLEGFMAHPDRTLLSGIIHLPSPNHFPEEAWHKALTRATRPDDRLRFIQYFQVHPRAFQAALLLDQWHPDPTDPAEEEVYTGLIQLLEYVAGLYRLNQDLDWWQSHWHRSETSWSGLTRSIGREFLQSWRQTGSMEPDHLAFILRQCPTLLSHGPRWQEIVRQWDQPDRILSLPLDSLSATNDLPFLLEMGLSPDRIAGLFPAFALGDAASMTKFLRTLLDAAVQDGTLPEVANRLFNHATYRSWLTQADQAEWRQTVQEDIRSWLEGALWISAYDEATALAQATWCQSSGDPDQWIDMLFAEPRDPALNQQILALLCRDLDLKGLSILMVRLKDAEPSVRKLLSDQVLHAFALPALDWDRPSSYLSMLTSTNPELEALLAEALKDLSPAFAPPNEADVTEWIRHLLHEEYVRPMFGYRPAPRRYPVATALTWWICHFQGQSEALQALYEYRQSDDLNALVKAADLPNHVREGTGINSLFDPDYSHFSSH